jgi:hypothetical protein
MDEQKAVQSKEPKIEDAVGREASRSSVVSGQKKKGGGLGYLLKMRTSWK